MLFLIVILAIIDKRNSEISHPFKAILLGSTMFSIGVSFGMNSGYALNPVRGR
jgi:glycerol uptake facilitator-like aquaporin